MENRQAVLHELGFGFLGPHKVAGMAEPWRKKLGETFAALAEAGIGASLVLTEEDPYGRDHVEAGLVHLHLPVDDMEPPDEKTLERGMEFIDSCLGRGLGVVVQCLEGRGRTGTFLCAWLAKKEGLSAEKALVRTRRLRPLTIYSPSQKAFLRQTLS